MLIRTQTITLLQLFGESLLVPRVISKICIVGHDDTGQGDFQAQGLP